MIYTGNKISCAENSNDMEIKKTPIKLNFNSQTARYVHREGCHDIQHKAYLYQPLNFFKYQIQNKTYSTVVHDEQVPQLPKGVLIAAAQL